MNSAFSCAPPARVRPGVPVRHEAAALPEAHLEFFSTLVPYAICEKWVFAHAGLSPLEPLDDQKEEDLFWIRDEFIHNIHHFGKIVDIYW